MMASRGSGRGGLGWAILGGVVLLAGIVAIIVTALVSQSEPDSAPEPAATVSGTPPASESPRPDDDVVDPSAASKGWTAEPITTDAKTYARAALEVASTFDTTRASREEWLDYIDTWFTPDTRYSSTADQVAAMEASQVELRQGVVLPAQEWDSLAAEDGRVEARTTGSASLGPVTEDPSGAMTIGTADVTLTFTRSDSSGVESSYDEVVRVSVQVLCGAGSVPTPNTSQQAGDCKVVRYFTEPLEP